MENYLSMGLSIYLLGIWQFHFEIWNLSKFILHNLKMLSYKFTTVKSVSRKIYTDTLDKIAIIRIFLNEIV